ncbi:hypothetical protein Anas_07859 [Armadillidium nasatum]|uniref:Uncharacterized protein n=1 Tax=Armadillidium nasatum TaxID=96803 RepID=A0A5N5TC06_9CRUS|nr:hypothetical protein Anas_07859 [Armadillidium nasatum]
MGLAYDKDFDTLADDLPLQSNREDNIPTHLYAVVTRCLGGGGVACPPQYLDVQAFIFPQFLPTSNCMNDNLFWFFDFDSNIKFLLILLNSP